MSPNTHLPVPGTPSRGILARVVEHSARQPALTCLLVGLLCLFAYASMRKAPVDALPDLSDTQVIVLSEWAGQSPDLVEDQLTYPISSALLSAPQVEAVRGQSFFGLSFVYVIFEEGTDLYWARSRVSEVLATLGPSLPRGVEPELGPDATGVGWVLQYALVDRQGQHDLGEMRELQDWTLRYALESVPGVAEVAPVGGFVRELELRVDPLAMRARGVSLSELRSALSQANHESSGRTLELGGHEHIIRARGYLQSPEELAATPVKIGKGGVPIFVRDLGEVVWSPGPRRGFAELNGEGEVVGGIVVMRYGENALGVIQAVKARMQELQEGLPEGVEMQITYDRSELIEAAVGTLERTLVEEMIVVSLVIFVFLTHVRSALVPLLTLPIAVGLAFIPVAAQGLSVNIMSLGGIAVSVGAMVDASIVVIENLHQRLGDLSEEERAGPKRLEQAIVAMQEVAPSIFFSLMVITISFLPVFSLEGAEGRLFKPLAYTKTYTMGFGAVLAVTLTPALAAIFVRGKLTPERYSPINRVLGALYEPVVRWVVRRRKTVLILVGLLGVMTVPAAQRLGQEFMPPLNEGTILYMPSAPPGISMSEAGKVLQQMDRELKAIPEVETVFGKMGRAETATDPAPLAMAETVIVLKPRSEWREGLSWDELIAEMDEALRYPGLPNLWWMPIQTRTEMLATGVRSPVGIQVFGEDLAQLEAVATDIEAVMRELPGTRSAFAERATGGFYVDIEVDREAAARYGLRVEQVHELVQSGIGGEVVSQLVDGRARRPVRLRYAPEFRDGPEAVEAALLSLPSGAQVPLGQIATVRHRQGPAMIRSEQGQLVAFVFVDTDEAVGDFVKKAQRHLAERVELPAGVRLGWAGQYRYLERANERLRIAVPVTLLLVVLLLFLNTRSWVETGIVLLAVPFSLIGAVWLLYLLGFNLSVAVWVGLIALAGLDAETGVVMLLYLRMAHDKRKQEGALETKQELEDAIVEGAAKRIRPKVMTVLSTMLGLLPMLTSSGAGADVMQRIAAPMVGGLATSFFLELTVYPAVYAIWKGRGLRS